MRYHEFMNEREEKRSVLNVLVKKREGKKAVRKLKYRGKNNI
jgi:hypothetical protein